MEKDNEIEELAKWIGIEMAGKGNSPIGLAQCLIKLGYSRQPRKMLEASEIRKIIMKYSPDSDDYPSEVANEICSNFSLPQSNLKALEEKALDKVFNEFNYDAGLSPYVLLSLKETILKTFATPPEVGKVMSESEMHNIYYDASDQEISIPVSLGLRAIHSAMLKSRGGE